MGAPSLDLAGSGVGSGDAAARPFLNAEELTKFAAWMRARAEKYDRQIDEMRAFPILVQRAGLECHFSKVVASELEDERRALLGEGPKD
jgi:hypothetical protein